MPTLCEEVADLALRQSALALIQLPDDATPSQRASVVTTAVRALTAYREAVPGPWIHPEQEAPESPA